MDSHAADPRTVVLEFVEPCFLRVPIETVSPIGDELGRYAVSVPYVQPVPGSWSGHRVRAKRSLRSLRTGSGTSIVSRSAVCCVAKPWAPPTFVMRIQSRRKMAWEDAVAIAFDRGSACLAPLGMEQLPFLVSATTPAISTSKSPPRPKPMCFPKGMRAEVEPAREDCCRTRRRTR